MSHVRCTTFRAAAFAVATLGMTAGVGHSLIGAAPASAEPECASVIGSATVAIRKEGETERMQVVNRLSTDLEGRQRLVFRWENNANQLVLTTLTSASCLVTPAKSRFAGEAEATFNGESGWKVRFSFAISATHRFTFRIQAHKPKEGGFALQQKAAALSSETIA